jgi:hypothetical protein
MYGKTKRRDRRTAGCTAMRAAEDAACKPEMGVRRAMCGSDGWLNRGSRGTRRGTKGTSTWFLSWVRMRSSPWAVPCSASEPWFLASVAHRSPRCLWRVGTPTEVDGGAGEGVPFWRWGFDVTVERLTSWSALRCCCSTLGEGVKAEKRMYDRARRGKFCGPTSTTHRVGSAHCYRAISLPLLPLGNYAGPTNPNN